MAIALPSKKIQALIIIVLALFVAYIVSTLNVRSWFTSLTASAGKAVYDASLKSVATERTNSDLDTDKDGLKDWQESLWGTEIDRADSDGDGTLDGEEIEKGRDPKIAGPDDSLEKTRGVSASSVASFSASVSEDPNNISTSLSRDLFAKFMSLQSTGNLNAESQNELVASVINDINPGSIPPRYTISDVRAVDATNATYKAYGNELARIITTLRAATINNPTNDAAIAAYHSATQKLVALSVPATLGMNHLQIINSFNASHQMLPLLAEYQKDPVRALVAMKSFQSNADNVAQLFTTIAAELKNNGILFDSTEAGYIWNNYY
jgi:hypothetical protein